MTEKDSIDFLIEVLYNFDLNIGRVSRLVKLPLSLSIEDRKEKKTSTEEILRATVVFLHASFEDALREISRLKLSDPPAGILKKIPLAGISPTGQPQKFSLMELKKYKGKTVNDLIRESIDEFLDKTSFNSSIDVANMLGKLQIDVSNLRKYFASLEQMMLRRHQIVHRADKEDTPGDLRLAPIHSDDIMKWIRTVVSFIIEVTTLAMSPDVHREVVKLPLFKRITKSSTRTGKSKA